MKVHALLVVVLWTSFHTGACYSQNSRTHPVHSVAKNFKEGISNLPAAPATLADMFRSVEKAITNSQKADVYYWISRYYADRLKIDSALFYCEKIKEISLADKYEKGMGKYYLAKSYALFFRSKMDAEGLTKAIEIFGQYKDDLFSGFAYKQLARQYIQLNNFAGTKKSYHTSIVFLLRAQETNELQRVYYELGKSYYETFEADSAAFYLLTALQLAEKMNDPGRIFNASGILGELYLVTDKLDEAAKYLKYSLDTRIATTSKVLVRNRLGSYAGCLILKGEFEKAEAVMKEYEAINEKLGDDWGVINLNKIRGTYYYHRGDYPEALRYLREAFSRKGEIKAFTADVKNIFSYLAKTEYNMGMYDSALNHLPYVRTIANQLQYGADLLETSLLTSQCYEKKGNSDSAYYYFLQYDRIKDSIFTMQKEKTVIELTTKYETEKKEQRIKLLQGENELAAYQIRLKNGEIEKQSLLDVKKNQQLLLLSQQNEISRLEAVQKNLALQNQGKEIVKKQSELELLSKESQLQTAIATKENQQKKFAYAAVLAVLVFGGIIFYRYRQSHKLGKQLAVSLISLREAQDQLIKTEKEKEADNVRVRISRDIHDEVGATLSGVALFSEIAKQKMEQHRPEDAQVYLNHISANSKEMVEKMSDIVWAINPDNDSFERIIAKLQSYAFNLCAGKGISLHLNIDGEIQNDYPVMQVKRNLYLFMKEAINNAVKYSDGKNIFLSLQRKGDIIIAEIKDDGKGFDTKIENMGNGLKNMKERADSLEAKFTIDSSKGKGTCVRLQFHFHPAGGQSQAV
jgi:signal transduction histidine kinase/tetratricopeptide (TPR) repeat protein